MPMASYRFGRDGKFTVVLKNGQTYRQKEADLVLGVGAEQVDRGEDQCGS